MFIESSVLPSVAQRIECHMQTDIYERGRRLFLLDPVDRDDFRGRNPLFLDCESLHQLCCRSHQRSIRLLQSFCLHWRKFCGNDRVGRRRHGNFGNERLHPADGSRRASDGRLLGGLDQHEPGNGDRIDGASPPERYCSGNLVRVEELWIVELRVAAKQLEFAHLEQWHHRGRFVRERDLSELRSQDVRRADMWRELVLEPWG